MAHPMQEPPGGRIPEWTQGDRVRKARTDAELSQDRLADLTGISRQTVGNYENDHTRMSKGNARLIAMATGVDYRWLMGLTADGTPPDLPVSGSGCYSDAA